MVLFFQIPIGSSQTKACKNSQRSKFLELCHVATQKEFTLLRVSQNPIQRCNRIVDAIASEIVSFSCLSHPWRLYVSLRSGNIEAHYSTGSPCGLISASRQRYRSQHYLSRRMSCVSWWHIMYIMKWRPKSR